jgi:DNA modification methylase
VKLYSNPGELVFDPFMGIGSTAAVALEQQRRAAGFELKESYYEQALRNAESLIKPAAEATEAVALFDLGKAS